MRVSRCRLRNANPCWRSGLLNRRVASELLRTSDLRFVDGSAAGQRLATSLLPLCVSLIAIIHSSLDEISPGMLQALADVKELTTHAASAGAVAISAMPTSFFKPDGLDAIVSYFETIAACAPHLPLYYYHLAIKTGVYIRCDKLLAKIGALQVNEGRLKSFRGIKYSDAGGSTSCTMVAMTTTAAWHSHPSELPVVIY